MARKRLSEFRAKSILHAALGMPYSGMEVDMLDKQWKRHLPTDGGRYVVKVDQAVKGRFKKGLVKLDRTPKQIATDIAAMAEQGYRFFVVEPYVTHRPSQERYLAVNRTRAGIIITSSEHGGIDVEAHAEQLLTTTYKAGRPVPGLDIEPTVLSSLVDAFEVAYFSFLEINPLVVESDALNILDAAVEVDEAAGFFAKDYWQAEDIRSYAGKTLSSVEQRVRELNEQSQASFNLEILNPNGGLFLLLSGGGASVVVADEVYNLGYGDQLANYGEYSGGPNREETKTYTSAIIDALLASMAKQKTLIIAGGVANFTDVKATFAGVIDALSEHQAELKQQRVKVYVRRGGPNEIEGLQLMQDYLQSADILGVVRSPELVLADIVTVAVGAKS